MYDAIVLAGGRAHRLGGIDKPGLEVGGVSLLDRVLVAVCDAAVVVCAGPQRPTSRTVIWRHEHPPGAGPVAGLAAALPATTAATVLLLAADLPCLAPAVPVLLAALAADEDADTAVLVDSTGRPNHLAAAWRRSALQSALAGLGDPIGAPVRALARRARIVAVDDPDGWGRDCDTWDALEAVRERIARDQAVTRASPA